MRLYVLCAALAAGALCASHAQALDVNECGTPEGMTAKLRSEGQRAVALADELSAENEMRGMVFTVNADRSVGYFLRADRPSDEKAGMVCVQRRLADVRLHDARRAGISPAALLKAPEADALRRCDELARQGALSRGTCGSLNAALKRDEPNGVRPILQGLIVEKRNDGSYQPNGVLATVSGNVMRKRSDGDPAIRAIRGDIALSALPEGATIIDTVLVFPDYTPHGLTLLP